MSNREEFEKQMKGTFGMLVDLRAREGTGFSYMDWGTQVAWVMWQARVPEGYVVVTKEPTPKMIDVGMGSFCFPLDNGRFSNHDLIFAYRAMLEAVEK